MYLIQFFIYLFIFFSLAFSYLKDYERAASCYKQACDLEPNNVGYQNNYQLTLNHLQNPAGISNINLNTPHFMATAARLMSNPEVSSVYVSVQFSFY